MRARRRSSLICPVGVRLLCLIGTGVLLCTLGVWAGDTSSDPKVREEPAGRVDLKAYRPDGTFLSEDKEENPGWYINVNWDDDDKDGWNPDDHSPGATYAPDKGDPLVSGNGCTEDDDLWKFTVEVVPSSIHGPVKLTFDESKVKVYQSRTKANPFSSGGTVNFTGQPITLYMEGQAGTASFRAVELKGEYTGSTPNVDPDTVKVTVFEATLNGFFAESQETDNEKKFSNFIPGSSDRRGIISWDDANGDGTKGDMDANCLYFSNCVETQGTVLPSGVSANEATFDFTREKRSKEWYKVTSDSDWIVVPPGTWALDDDPNNSDEDLTPSTSNHIYHIDGPGCATRARQNPADYRFVALTFRECVYVILYGSKFQCSTWFKWYSKMYLVPKDAQFLTRGAMTYQGLETGWIAWPDSPPNP